MRCPRCGSENTAKILYGMPSFDGTLEAKIEAGKVKLGGCCINELSPEGYCNDCKQEFATPPVIIKEDGTIEDIRDAIISVYFLDGCFYGAYKGVKFEKREDKILLSVSLLYSMETHSEEITEKEWKKS